MIDLDNDRAMEVGYAIINRDHFTCRDLWTGKIEWEAILPPPINSQVIAADVAGDGLGELICSHAGGISVLKSEDENLETK